MEIDLKLCNFAAEKASLLGACPQQGVGMKVKNKPWHSLIYTPAKVDFFDIFIFNSVKSDHKITFYLSNKTFSEIELLPLLRNPKVGGGGVTPPSLELRII